MGRFAETAAEAGAEVHAVDLSEAVFAARENLRHRPNVHIYRADIMALGPRGQLAIVEVKSSLEDFRTDRKWGEYMPFCDAFFFAVAPEFPRDILPEEPGLIVADAFDGAVLREAPVSLLVGARRKALTIAFGRLAAVRATGV